MVSNVSDNARVEIEFAWVIRVHHGKKDDAYASEDKLESKYDKLDTLFRYVVIVPLHCATELPHLEGECVCVDEDTGGDGPAVYQKATPGHHELAVMVECTVCAQVGT